MGLLPRLGCNPYPSGRRPPVIIAVSYRWIITRALGFLWHGNTARRLSGMEWSAYKHMDSGAAGTNNSQAQLPQLVRETVPSQTSDVGKKAVSVLALIFAAIKG